MPAFSFRHIKDLYPVFWAKARESAQAIQDQVLGFDDDDSQRAGFLEVNSWASRLTLDIIGLAGLGKDFGAISDPTNPLFQAYHRVFKPSRQALILNMLKLILPASFVHALPVPRNHEIKTAAHTIRDTCFRLIREKKEKLAQKELCDLDVLSAALKSGGFSDKDLVDQVREPCRLKTNLN